MKKRAQQRAIPRGAIQLLVALLWLLPSFGTARAQGRAPSPIHEPAPLKAGEVPEELQGVGIEDRTSNDLPRDIALVGSDGRPFVLGEYMDGERPLVLVLAYYGCPMLCSMVLNGAVAALQGASDVAGRDFRFLVVSFDPRDTVSVASEKRASYLKALGTPVEPIGQSSLAAFEFATGTEAEVKRLSDAVGFRYRWSESEGQFAHGAGMFVVTPRGKLSQVLTGVEFEPAAVSAALGEARQGIWRSPIKSVLLYCFQFNPHTGTYVVVAGRAMQIGAAFTILILSAVLYRLFRAERRRRIAALSTGPS